MTGFEEELVVTCPDKLSNGLQCGRHGTQGLPEGLFPPSSLLSSLSKSPGTSALPGGFLLNCATGVEGQGLLTTTCSI